MFKDLSAAEYLHQGGESFVPSVSIDNGIFGFTDNKLKILLLQLKGGDNWVLPCGFIYKDEDIDDAAARILSTRTGLKTLFIQQFQVFGSAKRQHSDVMKAILKEDGYTLSNENWL